MKKAIITAAAILVSACSEGHDAPPVQISAPLPERGVPIGPDIVSNEFDPRITFDGIAMIESAGSVGITIRAANGSQRHMATVSCNVAAVGFDGQPVGRAIASWDRIPTGAVQDARAIFVGVESHADYDHAAWSCSWS